MIGKNNIYNIRTSTNSWIGQVGQTRGFCDFTSRSYCIRACGILLMRSYRKKGFKTIDDIIHRFAPPSENNTQRYIDFVSRSADIAPFEVLNSRVQYCKVMASMAKFESGESIGFMEILSVLKYFKIIVYKV